MNTIQSKVISKRFHHSVLKVSRRKTLGVAVLLFATVGVVLLISSHAATPMASFEVEAGTKTGGAAAATDSTASGSALVKFNTSSTASCPNPIHTPGGPDGMGGCWPYDGNTGVPAGTTLTAYTGPCTITTPTTIDAKTSSCDFVVKAALTIKRSVLTGHFDGDYGAQLTIEDSRLNGGSTSNPIVGYSDFILRRVNITGGQHNVLCSNNCTVEDSWLHDQYNAPGQGYHNNAYVSNGGHDQTIRHNSLFCEPPNNSTGGGCSTDGSIFGDFAPLADVTFDKNLFMATPSGAYCGTFGHNPAKTYGNNPTRITVSNNIFQRGPNGKCGTSAPVTSFMSANGNVWLNNKWDDGATVPAADD